MEIKLEKEMIEYIGNMQSNIKDCEAVIAASGSRLRQSQERMWDAIKKKYPFVGGKGYAERHWSVDSETGLLTNPVLDKIPEIDTTATVDLDPNDTST